MKMIKRTIILLAALSLLPLIPGCKCGGKCSPVSTINQEYNEGAKMPQVTPSWK